MAGFASLDRNSPLAAAGAAGAAPRPAPRYGIPPGGNISGAGVGSVGTAARQARYAMDTMGVPNFAEIMKGGGGFGGVTEFGNAGLAGQGAAFAKGELENFKGGLNAARADFAHPTQSAGFQAGMGLAREQTAGAVADERRQAAEAAQRRGYAGGYDPRQGDIDRMRALSEAGFAGVKDAREQALGQFGAEAQGYGDALGAYKDLLSTQAELPTKMLSALAPYYSSILGAGSDFFRASLGADQADRDFRQQQRTQQLTSHFGRPGTQISG